LARPAAPGWTATAAVRGLCQISLPDVRDAIKTLAQIDDAQELARTDIPRSLIWTRVLPGFESRVARHVRESVEGKELPVFSAALLERAAFRELHLTGKAPRQTDPKGAAAANVSAITQELLTRLESFQVAAA
jgi:chromosome partitioning protein